MFAKREWMRKGKSERERVKEIEREKKNDRTRDSRSRQ